MPQQTVYSASQPVGGAATRAKFQQGKQDRGLVPYFVSYALRPLTVYVRVLIFRALVSLLSYHMCVSCYAGALLAARA